MTPSAVLTGLSILIIGDSHLATPQYLLDPLHEAISAQSATVTSVGVCGSNAADWLRDTPSTCERADRSGSQPAVRTLDKTGTTAIRQLVASTKPDALIIVMGDNLAAYKNPIFPKTWAYQQVSSLTRELKSMGVPCYWVGPAYSQTPGRFNKTTERVNEVSTFLANNTAPCAYIDSTQFAPPGEWKTTDGQHYTRRFYEAWAGSIAQKVLQTPPVPLKP